MKSIHTKLNEALEALDKAGKRKQYSEKVQPPMTAETRLNLAEAILADKHGETPTKESTNPLKLEDIEECKRDYAILFGVEPRATKTTKEAAPIKKHNGSADNFVEGNPFNGERKQTITETDAYLAKEAEFRRRSDAITQAEYSEGDRRKLNNLPPVGSPELTGKQLREYRLNRSLFRLSEADSLRLALQVK
jgi:hypothetical protein